MGGTKEGGKLAAEINKRKYGDNFYRTIGAIGGSKKGENKGFAAMDKEKVRAAGRKGGYISRRSTYNKAEFVKVWNESISTADAARILGIAIRTAEIRSSTLRQQGYNLKYRINRTKNHAV